MDPSTEKYFHKCARGKWSDVLTVDPGLGGTGLAFWTSLSRIPEKPLPPSNTTAITVPPRAAWLDRVWAIAKEFQCMLDSWLPEIVIIEFQALWTGSEKSMASASRGDLFKLTILTGVLADVAYTDGAEVVLVKPGEWKGQLSKKSAGRRIKRAFGKRWPDHIEDAVGIGLAVQGRL